MSRNGMHQIGAAAQAVGLPVRALRQYDEEGVVVPSGCTAGGFRVYTDGDLDRLRLVKQMTALGLAPQEMQALLASRDRLTEDDGDGAGTAPVATAEEEAADEVRRLQATVAPLDDDAPRPVAPPTPPGAPSAPAAAAPSSAPDGASRPRRTPAEVVRWELRQLGRGDIPPEDRAELVERLARRATALERHSRELRAQAISAEELAATIREELTRAGRRPVPPHEPPRPATARRPVGRSSDRVAGNQPSGEHPAGIRR